MTLGDLIPILIRALVVVLVPLAVAGCAGLVRFTSAAPDAAVLDGAMFRPGSDDRRPAVVLLHPCGGPAPFISDWARWLAGQGYVALVVDSFSARNTANVCRGGSPSVRDAAGDAFGALRYLRSLTFVDGKRIGVMGWSYGGGAALLASREGTLARFGPNGTADGFQAAVAFYPPCELEGSTRSRRS